MENNNVILVVDDDTNILAIIEMYLKRKVIQWPPVPAVIRQ